MRKLDEIRQSLWLQKNQGERKRIREAGKHFSEIVLSSDNYPPECLSLMLEILEDREVLHKKGIDLFFVEMMTDILRLDREQKSIFLETVRENYRWYENPDICWILGDMIARRYPVQQALDFFEEMGDAALPQGRDGVALGLDVLFKANKDDAPVVKKIQTVLKAMQR